MISYYHAHLIGAIFSLNFLADLYLYNFRKKKEILFIFQIRINKCSIELSAKQNINYIQKLKISQRVSVVKNNKLITIKKGCEKKT